MIGAQLFPRVPTQVNLIGKVRLDLAVEDEFVQRVVAAVIKGRGAARTERPGWEMARFLFSRGECRTHQRWSLGRRGDLTSSRRKMGAMGQMGKGMRFACTFLAN